ncbi:MAG: hypothetical protein JWQ90_4892 [Hydrocarboniphaga sp.]|nr:hypothetical protein [Hydrocarboniphaga sp.]
MVFDALAAGDPSAAEQGKLILLLHGFPACDEEFREILPALAAAGYYAVAPSQRGYSAGARPTNDSDYTLDHMVGDTLSMATALGADRFHLVGHDWGGGVAWYVAAVAPSRLSTLTVLSTPHLDAFAAAGANPLSAQKEMSSYAKVFALPGIANILLSGGPKFFALGLVAFGLPLERAEIYANALKDPVALNAALAWYRANPLPPPTNQPIGPVIVPTLYAWGNLDFAFGANAAYHTRQYVDAPYQFVVLRGVNHWVADYEPERVIQLVTTQVQGDSP